MKTKFNALILGSCLLLSSASCADWSSAFPRLTTEDLQIITNTVKDNFENAEQGASANWSNDETGHSGSVHLVRNFSVAEHECKRIGYLIDATSTTRAWRLQIDFCRNDNGEWERQPGLFDLSD